MQTQTSLNGLTLALPKQEKLKNPIIVYLKSKGFMLAEDGETGVLVDTNGNIPKIRVEFVRAADALLLMERKVVDLAIIGSDVATENTCGKDPAFEKPDMKLDLGIAGCTFDLAVPDELLQNFKSPADVNGLRIATSYPNILEEWLKKNNIEASEIFVREGGVESSIRMGLADVVADLVDTGGTLRKNKLTSAYRIASTSAVCYARKNMDVLTSMLTNEFILQLRKNRSPVTTPTVQTAECAMA